MQMAPAQAGHYAYQHNGPMVQVATMAHPQDQAQNLSESRRSIQPASQGLGGRLGITPGVPPPNANTQNLQQAFERRLTYIEDDCRRAQMRFSETFANQKVGDQEKKGLFHLVSQLQQELKEERSRFEEIMEEIGSLTVALQQEKAWRGHCFTENLGSLKNEMQLRGDSVVRHFDEEVRQTNERAHQTEAKLDILERGITKMGGGGAHFAAELMEFFGLQSSARFSNAETASVVSDLSATTATPAVAAATVPAVAPSGVRSPPFVSSVSAGAGTSYNRGVQQASQSIQPSIGFPQSCMNQGYQARAPLPLGFSSRALSPTLSRADPGMLQPGSYPTPQVYMPSRDATQMGRPQHSSVSQGVQASRPAPASFAFRPSSPSGPRGH